MLRKDIYVRAGGEASKLKFSICFCVGMKNNTVNFSVPFFRMIGMTIDHSDSVILIARVLNNL